MSVKEPLLTPARGIAPTGRFPVRRSSCGQLNRSVVAECAAFRVLKRWSQGFVKQTLMRVLCEHDHRVSPSEFGIFIDRNIRES
jgi:hypothetical protein